MHCLTGRFSESLDEEPFLRESDPLEVDVDERLEELSVRCTTLSNIIRGFSFIAENEKVRLCPQYIQCVSSLLRWRLLAVGHPCLSSSVTPWSIHICGCGVVAAGRTSASARFVWTSAEVEGADGRAEGAAVLVVGVSGEPERAHSGHSQQRSWPHTTHQYAG